MKQYDLIVVGGGLSGVAAAVSAAREGLQVLLVEKSGALGGAMTNNLVYPFMKFWTLDPETGERVNLSTGIFFLSFGTCRSATAAPMGMPILIPNTINFFWMKW